MTKRGISVALLVMALLALGGASTAQAAGLSLSTAKRLAQQLGRKQVRTQGVVAYHLGNARRVGPNAVAFAYDARTEGHTYCVSVLTVSGRKKGRTTTITARIGRQKCIRIPADALKFEKVTRAAQRAVKRRTKVTRLSLGRVDRSLSRCETLRVPKSRRRAVAAITDVATVGALVVPNVAPLEKFVESLGTIETDNTTLDAAAAGWVDWADAVGSLPAITDPCGVLRRWAKRDWSSDSTPIDMAAYDATSKRTKTDVRAIVRGAKYLARVGVFPKAVLGFTPDGLLLQLKPKS